MSIGYVSGSEYRYYVLSRITVVYFFPNEVFRKDRINIKYPSFLVYRLMAFAFFNKFTSVVIGTFFFDMKSIKNAEIHA